eukprot:TRINITY_DN5431_c1_g1_i2.p1 TRINITY_DN5431_c1_g1~~TRINITY_DN5431_c1_g1_i2.p1  ORF type:complete len:472 (+),score=89.34 TRINITY_DN5431_c1_g1_i2:147-1562(+)
MQDPSKGLSASSPLSIPTRQHRFRKYFMYLLVLLFCPLANILMTSNNGTCDSIGINHTWSQGRDQPNFKSDFPVTSRLHENMMSRNSDEAAKDQENTIVVSEVFRSHKGSKKRMSVSEFQSLMEKTTKTVEQERDKEMLKTLPYEPVKHGGIDHFHRLPMRKMGFVTQQISSQDVDYDNQDFANYITVADDIFVLFEDYGSGSIERIYIAFTSFSYIGLMDAWIMHVEVDGKIVMTDILSNLGSAVAFPMIYPLSGTGERNNGYYFYLSIFYQKSCKIYVKIGDYPNPHKEPPRKYYEMGLYHTFTYHKFNFELPNMTAHTYRGYAEDMKDHFKLAGTYLKNLFKTYPDPIAKLSISSIHEKTTSGPLVQGINELVSYKGSGAIIGLYILLIDSKPEHYEKVNIRIQFDDLATTLVMTLKLPSPLQLFMRQSIPKCFKYAKSFFSFFFFLLPLIFFMEYTQHTALVMKENT